MVRREKDFVQYPGTGMWAMCTPGKPVSVYLYGSLPVQTVKDLVEQGAYRLYWIDTGMGAANLLNVMHGATSSSATLVTKAVLHRYLKERP